MILCLNTIKINVVSYLLLEGKCKSKTYLFAYLESISNCTSIHLKTANIEDKNTICLLSCNSLLHSLLHLASNFLDYLVDSN